MEPNQIIFASRTTAFTYNRETFQGQICYLSRCDGQPFLRSQHQEQQNPALAGRQIVPEALVRSVADRLTLQ